MSFDLDKDELAHQPATVVPGTSIRLRSKVAVDTSAPLMAAIEDDPLLKMLGEKLTPDQVAAEQLEIEQRRAVVRADHQALALRDWELACPPRLRMTEWHHLGLKPYLPQIRKVTGWKRSGQGIYAVGLSGRGKSRALWALLRRLAVDELQSIRYLSQGEIINEVNRTGLNTWLEKIDGLKNAPIVAWDDFGSFAAMTSRKDVLASELFELVDHRFNRELPMLITSNARTPDLVRLFAERAEPLMRRLTEGCTVVDFDISPP